MLSTLKHWMSLFLPLPDTLGYYIVRASIIFLICAIFARVLSWFFRRIFLSRYSVVSRQLSERRVKTLKTLIASIMNGLALLATSILILAMFIEPDALFTTLGLFSAALGFGAKPYVSDFLGGIVLLFEDQFAIGDKVEIGDRNVIGTVEQVSLRMTYIRGESGELWLVPNGDVRTIRNFSRGVWSPANIRLTIPTSKLDEVLLLLLEVIENPGADVIEKPEIISEAGEIGTATTTLLLKVKSTYGKAPQVRRRLLAHLQALFTEHHVLSDLPPHE